MVKMSIKSILQCIWVKIYYWKKNTFECLNTFILKNVNHLQNQRRIIIYNLFYLVKTITTKIWNDFLFYTFLNKFKFSTFIKMKDYFTRNINDIQKYFISRRKFLNFKSKSQ